ncbi:MAG: hypothetical protein EOS10_00170 [Mesorhizobium sp.]|uniref:hypothetical protein n=1 Tax=Mesorhizobium sp. TaxID=1871066 RepID=UPI000FE51FDA|nr:hypothetical protein [Mesorhizobium sp.]RWO34754.1 MAG: hypothetical protein EOS10_00170 [Mesorhizobium sp.]
MTAVLVLFVSLLDGTQREPIVLTGAMPHLMCMSLSQPMAAKWQGEHPKHKIIKIACADPKQLAAYLGRHAA